MNERLYYRLQCKDYDNKHFANIMRKRKQLTKTPVKIREKNPPEGPEYI